jgi:hypothetical protein
MKWQTPSFEEINMSAEIGGYQGDLPDRDDAPPAPALKNEDESDTAS